MAASQGLSPGKARQIFAVELLKLEMNNEDFVATLNAKGFFSGNQRADMLSKATEKAKATFFLDYIIDRDVDVEFVRLLDVMENFGGSMQRLATKIKAEMGQNAKPKSTTPSKPPPKKSRKRERTPSESDSADESPKKKSHHYKGTPTYVDLTEHFSVVVKWKTLAAYLLDDPDGSTCEQIDSTYKGDVKECVDALIKEYLRGDDVSWERVLDSLRKSKYTNLANKIEKSLKKK